MATTDEDRQEIHEGRAAMLDEIDLEPFVELAAVADVDAAGVRCRVLTPWDARGTLLYLHGGGFVFGNADTHERIARRLAATTGRVVVLADYRLAPEDLFPAAYDDALAVADWLTGSGLPAPYAVLGDSAGANLALGLALARPRLFVSQALVYPFLDVSLAGYDRALPDSAEQLEEYAWYWRQYLPEGAETDPRADPLCAESYDGLPPTLIQSAGLDALTTVGRDLAARLESDGVEVETEVFDGMAHGFWRRAEFGQSQLALESVAAFLDR